MREVRQMAVAAAVTLVTVAGVLVVSPVIDGGEGFARENAIVVIAGVCLFNSLYVALRVNDIGEGIADAAAGGSEQRDKEPRGDLSEKQQGITPR
ncbi:hypothetical protein VJ920_01655 [Adlercreutzia sp. R22]|uniref:Uncharacterized protein n=2 Tax=Adlercreutzia shanghongiae TaxID=3111773 RepID=A0ABU6IW17_9ACTN|nr:hypothetical protein [Adlercreutzia sp. R22]